MHNLGHYSFRVVDVPKSERNQEADFADCTHTPVEKVLVLVDVSRLEGDVHSFLLMIKAASLRNSYDEYLETADSV